MQIRQKSAILLRERLHPFHWRNAKLSEEVICLFSSEQQALCAATKLLDALSAPPLMNCRKLKAQN